MTAPCSLAAAPSLATTFLRKVVLPIAGLVALGLLVATVLALWAAREQNQVALRGSVQIAAMALRSRIEPIVSRVTDYSPWDELLERCSGEIDTAWLDEHVGRWVLDNYGDEMSFVIGPDGATRYALVDGEHVPGTAGDHLGAGLDGLIAASRAAPALRSIRHGLVATAHGGIAMVALAGIRAEDDGISIDGAQRSLLVLADRLSPAVVAELGGSFGLRRLHLTDAASLAAADAALPLTSADGIPLGALAWQPEQPGRDFLERVIPAFGLGLLILTPVVWLVLRQARSGAAAIIADERRARFQALHDALTGLPNRVLFTERLEAALSRTPRDGHGVALFWLDLDRFKEVNDSLGHAVGDLLLAAVADRFRQVVRDGDTVARLGGDEFAIIQDAEQPRQAAVRLAERLLATVEKPFRLDGNEVRVSLSIGIALAGDAIDAGDLARHADTALYRAKRGGRAGFAVFEPSEVQSLAALPRLQAVAPLLLRDLARPA